MLSRARLPLRNLLHSFSRPPSCSFFSSTASSTQSPVGSASAPFTVLSGIQPSGIPHLGNYLGALLPWLRLQRDALPGSTLLFSLVDLHSLTSRLDPAVRRTYLYDTLAAMLAVGLDPDRSIIFKQSAVSAHSELMWILSCTTSVGYLFRMTQWKSKVGMKSNDYTLDESSIGKLELGLLSYPVLQAADILLYQATHVPVGHDQTQHLEFARHTARAFNHQYGQNVFIAPETLVPDAKSIKSLSRPDTKMSKSDATTSPKSAISLTDSRETIFEKIKAATTDSLPGITYEPEKRPGVSNLLQILYEFGVKGEGKSAETIEEFSRQFADCSKSAFKPVVAEAVDAHLASIRDRLAELRGTAAGRRKMDEVMEKGGTEAKIQAGLTMDKVRFAMGI